MTRPLPLALCLLALSAAPASAAPPVRPLARILLDLDDAGLAQVKKVAELQAKEQ